jgi:hypothetical protein
MQPVQKGPRGQASGCKVITETVINTAPVHGPVWLLSGYATAAVVTGPQRAPKSVFTDPGPKVARF